MLVNKYTCLYCGKISPKTCLPLVVCKRERCPQVAAAPFISADGVYPCFPTENNEHTICHLLHTALCEYTESGALLGGRSQFRPSGRLFYIHSNQQTNGSRLLTGAPGLKRNVTLHLDSASICTAGPLADKNRPWKKSLGIQILKIIQGQN